MRKFLSYVSIIIFLLGCTKFGKNLTVRGKVINAVTNQGIPNEKVKILKSTGIYLGNHVTQKTDFNDFTSEPNAVVEAQAVNEIIFKPGVHLKAGTTFHAFIGDIICAKSAYVSDNNENSNSENNINSINSKRILVSSKPVVYPNPNNGSFKIKWNEFDTDKQLNLSVYDLSGKLLFQS